MQHIEHEILEYTAKEYIAGGLKHYAAVTTELTKGLSPEDRLNVLTQFTFIVNRLLREHREQTTNAQS